MRHVFYATLILIELFLLSINLPHAFDGQPLNIFAAFLCAACAIGIGFMWKKSIDRGY